MQSIAAQLKPSLPLLVDAASSAAHGGFSKRRSQGQALKAATEAVSKVSIAVVYHHDEVPEVPVALSSRLAAIQKWMWWLASDRLEVSYRLIFVRQVF